MSEKICKVCKNYYNKNENRPFLLECGDTLCLKCIKNYKEALKKDIFECPTCCTNTKSLNVENKMAYPKEGEIVSLNSNIKVPEKGEFEVFIRPKVEADKYSLLVTKTMTIGQLKDKIEREKGYNKKNFALAFKKPLNDDSKTLESYGITKTVTITQISVVEGGF